LIRFRAVRHAVLTLCLCLPDSGALAAPGGAELLQACRQALTNGFAGVEGQMCAWYVTPCACEAGRKPGVPRVCLPETVATESLAREVVTGLVAQPELQSLDADISAAMILSRIYPCTE
jgi:hypothetical protein